MTELNKDMKCTRSFEWSIDNREYFAKKSGYRKETVHKRSVADNVYNQTANGYTYKHKHSFFYENVNSTLAIASICGFGRVIKSTQSPLIITIQTR